MEIAHNSLSTALPPPHLCEHLHYLDSQDLIILRSYDDVHAYSIIYPRVAWTACISAQRDPGFP